MEKENNKETATEPTTNAFLLRRLFIFSIIEKCKLS